MDRIVVKRSTIFVSVGEDLKVFRSVREVPPGLRRKLLECTSGGASEVILIADQRGKHEIEKALQALPPESRSKVQAAVRVHKTPGFNLRRFRPWPEILLGLFTAGVIATALFYR